MALRLVPCLSIQIYVFPFGLEGGEQLIATFAGLVQIMGAEAFAHAFFGVVGQMQGVMKPQNAVVVPQMMVRVSSVDSD